MPTLSLHRCAALAVLTFAAGLAAAQTLTVQAVRGGAVTELSADGRVAVGEANRTYEPFRWTAESGLVKLGRGTIVPLGHRSGTTSVSADGSVVMATILSDDGLTSTAGRWTAETGWQMLRPLPADAGLLDGEDSSVFGMSRDGRVATGLYWRPGQSGGLAHAMRWSADAGMTDLGSSGFSSRADAASADGSVIAGWDEHPQFGNRRAAVWVNGVRTVLDESDWPSEASAVSSDGRVVVGNAADPANGFQMSATMWRWQDGAWAKTVLGVINKRRAQGFAYPNGVSDDGSTVVGINRPDMFSPNSIGFIWTATGGFVDVADWMAAGGATPGALQKVFNVSALSADGSTLAVLTQNRRTGAIGTLLVRRAP
jgi:uncharacterized membrane protein